MYIFLSGKNKYVFEITVDEVFLVLLVFLVRDTTWKGFWRRDLHKKFAL